MDDTQATGPQTTRTVGRAPGGPGGLLTVSRLREELERLERHGRGGWDIDVVPSFDIPGAGEGRPDLAFDVHGYGVVKLDALGSGIDAPGERFIAIYFGPRPEAG